MGTSLVSSVILLLLWLETQQFFVQAMVFGTEAYPPVNVSKNLFINVL